MSSQATVPLNSTEQPATEQPNKGAAQAEEPKHATARQMLLLCIWLVAWMIGLIWQITVGINEAADEAMAAVSVAWNMPPEIVLNSGPAAFRYDMAQRRLIHHGVITPERRLELRALLTMRPPAAPVEQATPTPSPAVVAVESPAQVNPPATGAAPRASAGQKIAESPVTAATLESFRPAYNEAIDTLTFLASTRQGKMIGLLLFLGGLGGALGAILRSLVDFVGHACYTGKLDLVKWWPLYFTRPIVGWILGFVLVVMFKAQFLAPGQASPSDDSLWWLGMAVLGGFSTVDVTQRLRLGAKALFGVEKSATSEEGDKAKEEKKKKDAAGTETPHAKS